MYGYLYITTNLLNNKRYIGQKRGNFCPTYFGSGNGIKNAIKIYGIKWFRVDFIKSFSTKDELNNSEIKLIKNYRDLYGRELLYNQSDGGTGGDNLKNNPNKEKIYKNISIKLSGRKGNVSYWLGKKQSEESNKKRSIKLKGRKLTEEHKLKKSLALIGNKNSKGVKRSEETKKRMSDARKRWYEARSKQQVGLQ